MNRNKFIIDNSERLKKGQVWILKDEWAMQSECDLPKRLKLLELIKYKEDDEWVAKWKIDNFGSSEAFNFKGYFKISEFMLPADILKYYEQI